MQPLDNPPRAYYRLHVFKRTTKKGRKRIVQKYVGLYRHQGKSKPRLMQYRRVKDFKNIQRRVKNDGYLQSATDFAAEKILATKAKTGLIRIRVYGTFGGKRRFITAYTRFSKGTKEYRMRANKAQRIEFISRLIVSAAIRRIHSVKGSFSPERKRQKESKKFARFNVRSLKVDAIL